VPPADTTPVVPPADTTPVVPPADTTPVVPPADNTPVVPPVDNTPVVPPVDNTPVVPPADNTPVVPPVDNTPVVPPVDNTPVVPPVDNTPVDNIAAQASTSIIADSKSPTGFSNAYGDPVNQDGSPYTAPAPASSDSSSNPTDQSSALGSALAALASGAVTTATSSTPTTTTSSTPAKTTTTSSTPAKTTSNTPTTTSGLGSLSSGTAAANTLGGITLPVATTVKGTQIADPLSSTYTAPVYTYQQPSYNPQQLTEIQQAKGGGIMHKAMGGSADFPAVPGLSHGSPVQHASLFGMHGAPLTAMPHMQDGGPTSYEDRVLPETHNPQFFSEGGLNSIHHRYVTGQGDGTSDSIPAMLANGEFVIPADVVSSLGNGSNDSGAKVLDEFLKTIREHKRKADAKHLPPDSKGALGYLLEAKHKAKV